MRFLLYSPDSYGLGHVRRSISLARAALDKVPGSWALLLTGAPRAHYFEYPPRCEYFKLPSVTKDREGKYICRDLDFSLEKTVELRSGMIRLAVSSFDADVVWVDHSPLGLCGEVLPILESLGRGPRRAVRVLGMRDVIDEPAAVKAVWKKQGVIDVLRDYYDQILIYGQRDVFDPIREYEFPRDVAKKTKFVGYISRNGRKAIPGALKARYAPRTGRLVVVTLGGGGDGNLVLRSFLEGYESLGKDPSFEVAAVTGPLMSPGKRRRFREWAGRLPGLQLLEYTDQMPDLMEAADFVVSMGGYNTTCELACAGARALIVPRTHPRKEQLVRARRLAERGVCTFVESSQPSPAVLMDRVIEGLERPRPLPGWGLEFTGLRRAVESVTRIQALGMKRGGAAWPAPLSAGAATEIKPVGSKRSRRNG